LAESEEPDGTGSDAGWLRRIGVGRLPWGPEIRAGNAWPYPLAFECRFSRVAAMLKSVPISLGGARDRPLCASFIIAGSVQVLNPFSLRLNQFKEAVRSSCIRRICTKLPF
jgi:hypothetical protein